MSRNKIVIVEAPGGGGGGISEGDLEAALQNYVTITAFNATLANYVTRDDLTVFQPNLLVMLGSPDILSPSQNEVVLSDPTVSLALPKDTTLFLNPTIVEPSAIIFEWEASNDPGFSNIVGHGISRPVPLITVYETDKIYGLSPNTTYYLRARVVSGTFKSKWTETLTFQTGSRFVSSDVPTVTISRNSKLYRQGVATYNPLISVIIPPPNGDALYSSNIEYEVYEKKDSGENKRIYSGESVIMDTLNYEYRVPEFIFKSNRTYELHTRLVYGDKSRSSTFVEEIVRGDKDEFSSWVAVKNMPHPTYRAAVVQLSATEIMVIGGIDGNDNYVPYYQIYNTVDDSWTSDFIPGDFSDLSAGVVATRGIDNTIYVGGGMETTQLIMIDLADFSWNLMPAGRTPLSNSGMVTRDDGMIYIVQYNSRNFYLLDPIAGRYSRLKNRPGNQRHGINVLDMYGDLLSIGGDSTFCYKYHENDNVWSNIDSIPRKLRWNGGIAGDRETIASVGGYDSRSRNYVYYYNTKYDTWSRGTRLPRALYGAACIHTSEGLGFIAGGMGSRGISRRTYLLMRS